MNHQLLHQRLSGTTISLLVISLSMFLLGTAFFTNTVHATEDNDNVAQPIGDADHHLIMSAIQRHYHRELTYIVYAFINIVPTFVFDNIMKLKSLKVRVAKKHPVSFPFTKVGYKHIGYSGVKKAVIFYVIGRFVTNKFKIQTIARLITAVRLVLHGVRFTFGKQRDRTRFPFPVRVYGVWLMISNVILTVLDVWYLRADGTGWQLFNPEDDETQTPSSPSPSPSPSPSSIEGEGDEADSTTHGSASSLKTIHLIIVSSLSLLSLIIAAIAYFVFVIKKRGTGHNHY